MSHRIALINYRNARTTGPLAILRYPAALRAELSEPNRDDFEVHDFVDQDGHTTIKQIYKIFETANSEDVVLLYFLGQYASSCDGSLYLLWPESDILRLEETSLDFDNPTSIANRFSAMFFVDAEADPIEAVSRRGLSLPDSKEVLVIAALNSSLGNNDVLLSIETRSV